MANTLEAATDAARIILNKTGSRRNAKKAARETARSMLRLSQSIKRPKMLLIGRTLYMVKLKRESMKIAKRAITVAETDPELNQQNSEEKSDHLSYTEASRPEKETCESKGTVAPEKHDNNNRTSITDLSSAPEKEISESNSPVALEKSSLDSETSADLSEPVVKVIEVSVKSKQVSSESKISNNTEYSSCDNKETDDDRDNNTKNTRDFPVGDKNDILDSELEIALTTSDGEEIPKEDQEAIKSFFLWKYLCACNSQESFFFDDGNVADNENNNQKDDVVVSPRGNNKLVENMAFGNAEMKDMIEKANKSSYEMAANVRDMVRDIPTVLRENFQSELSPQDDQNSSADRALPATEAQVQTREPEESPIVSFISKGNSEIKGMVKSFSGIWTKGTVSQTREPEESKESLSSLERNETSLDYSTEVSDYILSPALPAIIADNKEIKVMKQSGTVKDRYAPLNHLLESDDTFGDVSRPHTIEGNENQSSKKSYFVCTTE